MADRLQDEIHTITLGHLTSKLVSEFFLLLVSTNCISINPEQLQHGGRGGPFGTICVKFA